MNGDLDGTQIHVVSGNPNLIADVGARLQARGLRVHKLDPPPCLYWEWCCVRGGEDRKGLALAMEQRLSPRQIQVVQLAARGLTDCEIAAELTLSVRTVNRHMSDILAKLGCKSRREATRLIFGGPRCRL
jgi:DNA-binding CsgD family transcriptional regulator